MGTWSGIESPLGARQEQADTGWLSPAGILTDLPALRSPPHLALCSRTYSGWIDCQKRVSTISSLDGQNQSKLPKGLALYQEDTFRDYSEASALFSWMMVILKSIK